MNTYYANYLIWYSQEWSAIAGPIFRQTLRSREVMEPVWGHVTDPGCSGLWFWLLGPRGPGLNHCVTRPPALASTTLSCASENTGFWTFFPSPVPCSSEGFQSACPPSLNGASLPVTKHLLHSRSYTATVRLACNPTRIDHISSFSDENPCPLSHK